MNKDLTGTLVFGFGGLSDMTPCIYRDNGWYDGTIEEYNIRRVEQVNLLEGLSWDHPLVHAALCRESYGHHCGGGISNLYEIPEEQINELVSENNKILEAKQQKEAEQQAELEQQEKAERERKEAIKASLNCEILQQVEGVGGEGGIDPSAIVRMTDPETWESLEFICRNIFDFGYVINPNYSIAPGHDNGGLDGNGKWRDFDVAKGGWYDVREMTDFEKRCLTYLRELPPIDKSIRM